MLPALMLAQLEKAINHYISLDIESGRRLAGLAGRCVAVELSGTGVILYFSVDTTGITVTRHAPAQVDVLMSAEPFTLARLLANGQGGDGVLRGEIRMQGDSDTGQRFQRLLQGVNVDWEEQLSRLLGDVAAHKLNRAAQGFFSWGKEALQNLSLDVSEYLRFESRDLPLAAQVNDYIGAVDTLRNDTDRLAARIARLRRRLD